MIDYDSDRFGSARWANAYDITRAGMFDGDGILFGYFNDRPMQTRSLAPGLIVAGSGGGKFVTVQAETVLRAADRNFWLFDPKGEITATTFNAFAAKGADLFICNPFGLHGLPQTTVNPFALVTPDNPRRHADTAALMTALIAETSDNPYFVNTAREWCGGIVLARVEQNGKSSPTDLYHVARAIVSDASAWDTQLTFMERSPDVVIRGVAGEIWDKQKNAPREFQAIYGTIMLALSFLNDPQNRAAMADSDFSFERLCRPGARPCSFSLILPAQYIKPYAAMVRLLFASTVLTKYRYPGGSPLHMMVDETGQLGRFEMALETVTYGRGAGIIPEFVFQDIGQIVRNYGQSAVQTFVGSSERRRFFAIRDYDTAHLIARMLGAQTLDYNDRAAQEAAEHHAIEALRRYAQGGDPVRAAHEFVFHDAAARRTSKMQRFLMNADELMAMPDNRMIAMISGRDLPPIYAERYPYYTMRDLVGLWLPNPHHPPTDQVIVPDGRTGRKAARVITRDVPRELAHFPQYATGTLQYVEGFYPF